MQHRQHWQACPCKQSRAGMSIRLEYFRHRMGQATPFMGVNTTLPVQTFLLLRAQCV